ncbi:MAG: SUMF1/EgtB/PvdO family nonheme iron enzyme [Candidatus Alcyoniella australis]|nr:SUMF1/EgtB/PvdO family nonheme iron enzyme [Candidatus Alcyoniella australis]
MRLLTLLLVALCLGCSGKGERPAMVEVPSGPCIIGADRDQDGDSTPDEWPLRTVEVGRFEIDRLETTLGQYLECVAVGACPATPEELHNVPSNSCNWSRADKLEHPVNCVTWKQADAYCRWKNKRLPSEIEWEKAARGTDGRRYPWGEQWIPGRANVGDGRFTQPVGGYPKGASPYGMLDALGNVMEWTADSYEEGLNPGISQRAARGKNRVVRGGGFGSGDWGRRLSYRDWYAPDHRDPRIGFRCARGPALPTDVKKATPCRFAGFSQKLRVPAGEFTVGCDPQQRDDCQPGNPSRKVRLHSFEIDAREVGVYDYLQCVQAGKCTLPDPGKYCNFGKADRLDHPVNCIDQQQARDYCAFRNGRLPTALEWEKAARGIDGRRFPWGESQPTCNLTCSGINGSGCGKDRTFVAGSLLAGASPYGALDMAGNVWEWTVDRDPARDGAMIVKGGAWDERAGLPAYRFRSHPAAARVDNVGLRCVYASPN